MGVSPPWPTLSHVVVAAWVCDGGAHIAHDQDRACFENELRAHAVGLLWGRKLSDTGWERLGRLWMCAQKL
jgi:hypothetical protein